MTIKFERLSDLFDDNIVQEMIGYADASNCCHYNAATICNEFRDWECIDYCEGYYAGGCGHAFNCYNDYDGNKHYFDVTQELYLSIGLIKEFKEEAQLVTTFENGTEAIEKFEMAGETSLLTVSVMLRT